MCSDQCDWENKHKALQSMESVGRDPRTDWMNPDPERVKLFLKEEMKLNDDQLAAACSDVCLAKLIIAGQLTECIPACSHL